MMPALHCAITSSGPETKNSGEPITGIDRVIFNMLWYCHFLAPYN